MVQCSLASEMGSLFDLVCFIHLILPDRKSLTYSQVLDYTRPRCHLLWTRYQVASIELCIGDLGYGFRSVESRLAGLSFTWCKFDWRGPLGQPPPADHIVPVCSVQWSVHFDVRSRGICIILAEEATTTRDASSRRPELDILAATSVRILGAYIDRNDFVTLAGVAEHLPGKHSVLQRWA